VDGGEKPLLGTPLTRTEGAEAGDKGLAEELLRLSGEVRCTFDRSIVADVVRVLLRVWTMQRVLQTMSD
jgi:hypothetical protein